MYFTLIKSVGAGQTGLQIAARFKQLGLRTLVFEKHARVGDQWRERYRTLSTNTPKQQHARMLGWPEVCQ